MKILVQSDDYGFTRGIIAGMCDAFERGIITSTGIFINMPICDEAIEKINKYPHICLGIDINVTSGPCVSSPVRLPTLVNQDTGMFIRTSERIHDPRWGQDVFKPYDEVFTEACAQIEKFIELVGRKPAYLQSHSTSGSKIYLSAIRDAAHQYEVPFSYEVKAAYGIKDLIPPVLNEGDPWSVENQMVDRTSQMLELLEQNKDAEYVCLGSHCGFVDAEIMHLSRCNIQRAYDHEYLTSERIKKWISDHNAILISYHDLPLNIMEEI